MKIKASNKLKKNVNVILVIVLVAFIIGTLLTSLFKEGFQEGVSDISANMMLMPSMDLSMNSIKPSNNSNIKLPMNLKPIGTGGPMPSQQGTGFATVK
jgi:hypothetical protein